MQAVLVMFRSDGERREEELRPVTVDSAQAEEIVPLGEEGLDEDAPTVEPNALDGSNEDSGAGAAVASRKPNGGGSHEDLDLGELQPMGDSEDAAFDALTSDNDQPLEELEIDLDA